MAKGKERKTEIKVFEVIEAKHVAIANTRLYINSPKVLLAQFKER